MRRLHAIILSVAVSLALPWTAYPGDGLGVKPPLTAWLVPPLSSSRILPTLSAPGKILDSFPSIDILAAIGEEEPASFVLRSTAPVARLLASPTDLTDGKGNRLPSSILDLYVVVTWYQGGNAWFLGKREPGPAVLVPELLLHDQTLVTTTQTKKNRIRTASGYVEVDENAPAPAMPFLAAEDSKALVPFALPSQELRQFYLLARIPSTAKPGIYTGSVNLSADGKGVGALPVTLRVLPFRLPAPSTRFNRQRLYEVLLQGASSPIPPPLAEAIVRQGVTRVVAPAGTTASTVGTAKDGVTWIPAGDGLSGGGALPETGGLQKEKVFLLRDPADRSEPSAKALEKATLAGFRTAVAAEPDAIYETLSPLVSACLCDPLPAPQLVMRWHAIRGRLISTAPLALAGVENPEVWRRRIGVLPYQQGADGVILPPPYDRTSWSDSDSTRPGAGRAPALVYPTTGRPIPTLAWEAVREGVDDVRYLTLLSKLADGCLASPDAKIRTEGRLAGVWLDRMKASTGDLDGLRLEAIAWILRLQQVYALANGGENSHE